jgi:hypothetical protein
VAPAPPIDDDAAFVADHAAVTVADTTEETQRAEKKARKQSKTGDVRSNGIGDVDGKMLGLKAKETITLRLIGAPGVGKTSLAVRYATTKFPMKEVVNLFPRRHATKRVVTVRVDDEKDAKVERVCVCINIADALPNETITTGKSLMRHDKDIDGIVAVFAIDDVASCNSVVDTIKQLIATAGDAMPPYCLVGLKSDERDARADAVDRAIAQAALRDRQRIRGVGVGIGVGVGDDDDDVNDDGAEVGRNGGVYLKDVSEAAGARQRRRLAQRTRPDAAVLVTHGDDDDDDDDGGGGGGSGEVAKARRRLRALTDRQLFARRAAQLPGCLFYDECSAIAGVAVDGRDGVIECMVDRAISHRRAASSSSCVIS